MRHRKPKSPPDGPAKKPAAGDPIVPDAAQAVAKLFTSTFEALSENIETMLKTNTGSDAVATALTVLTRDMIKLLSERVRSAAPPGKAPHARSNEPSKSKQGTDGKT